MKTFVEMFTTARSVGTPAVSVRTADNSGTIRALRASIKSDAAPMLVWDCVTGLNGLNDAGTKQLSVMLKDAGEVERGATPALALTLGVLRFAPVDEKGASDLIVFIHNVQMHTENQPDVIQGVANLRDRYKASGAMLVFLMATGAILPTEWQQDVLLLDQPLPTRDELAKIVVETAKFAKATLKPDVIKAAVDAGIGLPAFPYEQSVAMTIDSETKELDIETLWTRKRDIVSQNPGLTYHAGKETLDDMFGCESWVKASVSLMQGKYEPTVIVRMDEIQRQLAGSDSDSSGTKGNLMGEFLTWVNDRKVICTLNVGVSGTSKSWGAYCIGGQFNKPVINYSVPDMEHHHVGQSSTNMRTAHRVLDAIGDGRIWLIATANSLRGLPPELISRFQVGGIYFFDIPSEAEKAGILALKMKMYGISNNQELPTMGNWTGRDIDNCCRKADLLGLSLIEAAQYVVPLYTSHKDEIEQMRMSASGRFLSASHAGLYEYEPVKDVAQEPVVANGRRIR